MPADRETVVNSASDRATGPKRIATFLQLCATFIPCDHSAYDQAVFSLDAEVDADVDRAKAVLALVRDQHLPIISKLQNEAAFVLLQVLYALYQGHVQFLLGDYKDRLIDAHSPEAFPKKVSRQGKDGLPRSFRDKRAPAPDTEQADDDLSKVLDVHGPDAFPKRMQRLGKDGRPLMTYAGHELIHNPEQADVDLSKEDDDESMTSKDSGSSILYTSGSEEDKANTPVSSTPQMEATHSHSGMSMPPKTTEAADFGSDTSPRTKSGE
jgi:hypothetical protein